jgi:hypothetical protein
LQFGERPAFPGVVGKLIVGEDSLWNNVWSHIKSSLVGDYVQMLGEGGRSALVAWRCQCPAR